MVGAKIDVWQATAEGFYAVQQDGIQPAFNRRGECRTNQAGQYRRRGIK
ncbi:MAG: dioxygenase family protein [Paracoccaceae bacterium]|nr:hypothetical protein [Seohaeicola saemankumensis]